jgi:hypothetical protein
MGIFSRRKILKDYYNTGEIERIYQTLNNHIDGWLKLYHKNGQLKAKINYRNGIQVDEKINSFDENGNLIRTVEFKNGFLNGPYKEFYSSGKIKTEGFYSNDLIIEKKSYYENSTLKYHYIKSENETKSKILDEDLKYIKNNLDQLPKFSVLYTSNNDFEKFLFDSYESALIKFESISNKILDISKEYEINEINNPDFIELVELCELLEISQNDVSKLISIEDKNELIDLWNEIHSESSHRHLSKFTSLINDDIELREFEGRTYFTFGNSLTNINYIPIELIHIANSQNFINHTKLINEIKNTKNTSIQRIEASFFKSEFKNLFVVIDIFVSYYENKLKEDEYRIDEIIEENIASDIDIIFDYLFRNQMKDFNISDLINNLKIMYKIFEEEIGIDADFLKDTEIEDIKIIKAYYNKVNFYLLLDKILFEWNLLELDFKKYQKNASTSSIVNRLKEINDINESNNINYNKLEKLFKSILLDIENDNILDGYLKDDFLCFDYFTSLYYQEKTLSCLVAGDHLINKFPNTNNSNLFGILGELHLQISKYDKAAIYYNLCITNLFNENYVNDYSSQILHFCNRAQSFFGLFEFENQFINNIINDLNIYIRYYPNDLHVKDLYNIIINESNSTNKDSEINDFELEQIDSFVKNLLKDGKVEEVESLFTDLFSKMYKEEIKTRILKSKEIKNIGSDFYDFLLNSKSFISNSTLSSDLINKLIDFIDYILKNSITEIDIEKKIDILYLLEYEYNDEVYIKFSEDNLSKNLLSELIKHGEFIKKILSYFIDENKPSVYDTLANLFLLENRFDEAEKEILKCLSIEIREDDQKFEHNLTAAKIYFKNGNFSNGEKYYTKAIELGADEDSIIKFQQFLNKNNLKFNK